MSLALAVIRSDQRFLGDGLVARTLAKSGVARRVRWPHDRKALKRGTYEALILGRYTRFAATSRTSMLSGAKTSSCGARSTRCARVTSCTTWGPTSGW